MKNRVLKITRQATALSLSLLLLVGTVRAGINISNSDGITATGADGINYIGINGITATGADGVLTFGVNGITATGADGITATGADGITATGADGITATGADGITATGADGVTYPNTNSVTATKPSGITATGADGITATGADGVVFQTSDGAQYKADSIFITRPNGITISTANGLTAIGVNGITATGADGITATGADGITATGADGITATGADGITATGADGITISTTAGVTARTADGHFFNVSPDGITIRHADGITATGADGLAIPAAERLTISSRNLVPASVASRQTGLQSVDPELAFAIDQANTLADDSNINAVIVYHQLPTDADVADLQRIGILGGTRFRVLPAIYVSATAEQLMAVSRLRSVRSLYGNRTLTLNADPSQGLTGVERAQRDADLVRNNAGLPLSGRGVTVAVLDTGVDATHGDLAGRVSQNVKLADLQSASVGFNYPLNIENLPNTDQVYGHGTFVAGVIGGSGAKSGGRYTGVAPGARIVGMSAGDLNLVFVLNGFDYLLERGAALGVRVVNCSFSSNTVFDINDPVNVATKMLADRGVNVVFSAGNTGAGWHTLNPYAVAPWVVSVGATDFRGRLADFSSRGTFASQLFRPTLVAPGVRVVSLRSSGLSVTGVEGIGFNGDTGLAPGNIPFYTTASGTSFSAPQVAGAIALMLEANPRLTPAEVRDILQRTATPLSTYYAHEVGAGVLNTHAAVLEAAFPQRKLGNFRATLNRGQVRFVNDPLREIEGTVNASATGFDTTVEMPEGALVASMQIGWSMLSANDLGFAMYDATGKKQAEQNDINVPGVASNRERATISAPPAGAWRLNVKNTLGGLALTSQRFTGVLEVARAEYAPIRDIDALTSAQRAVVYQNIRSFVMSPSGQKFRPAQAVTRGELAEALVLGARVPQYVPAAPTYRDVRNASTLLFVESVQNAPQGALFIDVERGGSFAPNDAVGRLTAAVALVRAAGLQAEAESSQILPLPPLLDASLIPAALRGYVRVAISRGLLSATNSNFRPQAALTRLELAHAMAAMQKLQTQ
ncbi:MAG TPA: S8 family serine peptidase [Pyrinomonadaceae bacterium]|nr:S8 family serine peptidase [Pyrinomonadaceae bacterium]